MVNISMKCQEVVTNQWIESFAILTIKGILFGESCKHLSHFDKQAK